MPTQEVIANSDGKASRPWIAWFTTLGGLFGFYQTVQGNGEAATQETVLNFLPPFIVTDNPDTDSTDISLPAAAYSLQKGTVTVPSTGNDYSSVIVTFATPFTDPPNVQATAQGFPRGTNDPMSCIVSAKTTMGFTVSLACAVPTGGGGSTIDQSVDVDWVAIGL